MQKVSFTSHRPAVVLRGLIALYEDTTEDSLQGWFCLLRSEEEIR